MSKMNILSLVIAIIIMIGLFFVIVMSSPTVTSSSTVTSHTPDVDPRAEYVRTHDCRIAGRSEPITYLSYDGKLVTTTGSDDYWCGDVYVIVDRPAKSSSEQKP